MEITLALLLQDWLKLRGLRWYVKNDQLNMVLPGSLESAMVIHDNYVTFVGPTLCRRLINVFTGEQDRDINLIAADPKFFVKLEAAIRREERYLHFACNLRLLVKAIEAVWWPFIGVFFEWLFGMIEGVSELWRH